MDFGQAMQALREGHKVASGNYWGWLELIPAHVEGPSNWPDRIRRMGRFCAADYSFPSWELLANNWRIHTE
jgi:hypothetical protein